MPWALYRGTFGHAWQPWRFWPVWRFPESGPSLVWLPSNAAIRDRSHMFRYGWRWDAGVSICPMSSPT